MKNKKEIAELPTKAKLIFITSYNNAIKMNNTVEDSVAIAWSCVLKFYKKGKKFWRRI